MVSDIFTDCYLMESADAKLDADSLMDEVGLGLRKSKVKVKNLYGVIFAFVDNRGPSVLMAERADLSAGDRKLSTEERLRRTTMEMTVTCMDLVKSELKRASKLSFWVTAWQGCSGEEAKKKAVAADMEGRKAVERFERCFLVEVPCCSLACLQLTSIFGLGQRKQMPRAREAPGAVAVFFTSYGLASPDTLAAVSLPKRRRTEQLPEGASSGHSEDMLSSGSPLLPLSTPAAQTPDRAMRTCSGGKSSIETPSKAEKPKTVAQTSIEDVDSEDLYFRQVTVLEKRLNELLPTLPRELIDTPFAQRKLEEYMRKPYGRLDKFKMDIARIWRAFVERRHDVPDLD